MNSPLFSWLVAVILSLLLAPLLPGIINRVKAFFAGRRGPSPFQLYYDIAKLLKKGSVYSSTATQILRLAPTWNFGINQMFAIQIPFSH